MRRHDLVVPAGVVGGLRVPPLAVTGGAGDPEWVAVPLSRWRFRRQPSLLVPLDPRSARSARRYVRFAPWSPVPAVVGLVALGVNGFADLSNSGRLAAVAVAGVVTVLWSLGPGRLPEQAPDRTSSGDLRLSAVPAEVAAEWVRLNPGVTATEAPAPERYSRRFYQAWSIGLVAAAIGLAVLLEIDAREDGVLVWLLVVVLFLAGLSAATKIRTRP